MSKINDRTTYTYIITILKDLLKRLIDLSSYLHPLYWFQGTPTVRD